MQLGVEGHGYCTQRQSHCGFCSIGMYSRQVIEPLDFWRVTARACIKLHVMRKKGCVQSLRLDFRRLVEGRRSVLVANGSDGTLHISGIPSLSWKHWARDRHIEGCSLLLKFCVRLVRTATSIGVLGRLLPNDHSCPRGLFFLSTSRFDYPLRHVDDYGANNRPRTC